MTPIDRSPGRPGAGEPAVLFARRATPPPGPASATAVRPGLASSRRPCARSSSPTCTSARASSATSCATREPLAALLARARRRRPARPARRRRRADGGPRDAGDGDRRAGPARDRRARRARTARSSLVPGNHDAPLDPPWLRANGGPAGLDAAGPADATPVLAARRRRGSARRGCASATPASGSPTASGRPTATTSTATCCRSRRYGVARGLLGRVPRDGATPGRLRARPQPVARPRVEAVVDRGAAPAGAALATTSPRSLRAATMPGMPPAGAAPPPRAADGARCSACRCAGRASRARRASSTASASTPTTSSSATSTAAGRSPATTRAAGAAPAGRRSSRTPARGSTRRCSCTGRAPPHPYWPGGAVLSRTTAPPRASGLLDHLGAAALQPPQTRAGSRPSST